ncbi:MAG TPA: hypothetical protein VGY54_11580 [Polyangiaceae bacterium]|nr:hypothetical protein [Polyangiaceae bacterium]
MTRFGPDFTPGRHTVSVLGVYKDGQMSTEAWNAIAARIAPSLGSPTCEAGYGNTLSKTNGGLASAIDDYARDNGPTDELLTELAPAAQGDLILVLTVAGKPPVPKKVSVQDAPPAQGAGMGQMRGGRRGGGQGAREDPNFFEMSALLFSVAQVRSVAVVSMQYSGQNVDEAITNFATKLHGTLPATKCTGWNWNTNVTLVH